MAPLGKQRLNVLPVLAAANTHTLDAAQRGRRGVCGGLGGRRVTRERDQATHCCTAAGTTQQLHAREQQPCVGKRRIGRGAPVRTRAGLGQADMPGVGAPLRDGRVVGGVPLERPTAPHRRQVRVGAPVACAHVEAVHVPGAVDVHEADALAALQVCAGGEARVRPVAASEAAIVPVHLAYVEAGRLEARVGATWRARNNRERGRQRMDP